MKNLILSVAIMAVMVIGCVGAPTSMPTQKEHFPWVIRTDFSNDRKWAAVRKLIAAPQTLVGMEFYANVKYVSDQKYSDLACNDLVHSLPDNYPGFICFLVDATTFSESEHPILVVGFSPNSLAMEDYQRTPQQTPDADIKTFRTIPSEIPSIENNLSIANMDFEDFARAVDADGVFRGFPEPE